MDIDSSDTEEIVEESYIQVTMDNPQELNMLNINSNVRVVGIDTESPVLQVQNKEWKCVHGTALFFEQLKEKQIIDPLYDNRCGVQLKYIGSTCKCLEMTKIEIPTEPSTSS
ncbi:uncharacterized protein LOC126847077 isoform X2 [Adelges cooleyi]|uniref:uncharacterized protein LOC126847077 isoform X2 n=1 Tax=Adelges cooleyi TaxID=133065 RepID=UPI00218041F6|nr:uncharacterized protein LOC126847077 isoform X2 [Adelges cooleyi]